MEKAERWLVKLDGKMAGELFKMHSAGRYCWLKHEAFVPLDEALHKHLHRPLAEQGHRTDAIRKNIALNGYIKAATQEDARAEIARRAGAGEADRALNCSSD
jgi:hypothetical protein